MFSLYQQFIYKSRYARWNEELGRREEWPETVARYFNFFEEHLQDKYGYKIDAEQRGWLEQLVLNLEVMPSMRAIMTAGPALKRENLASYNCSYLPIQDIRSFDETLYILMNGTGVGFSVENQYIQKLPVIVPTITKSDTAITVDDSKEGWARALRELISLLYSGIEPRIDISKVRPAGARLKTFGGRASGPEPLVDLFNFIIQKFYDCRGRKLSSLDCHDIVCKIAEVVVVGGVRRSALVSLSDLNDNEMRAAKTGQWWINNGQRALANNSAVYTDPPSMHTFMDEWHSLYDSKSGERGIFNRYAAKEHITKCGRRDSEFTIGSNPCVSGDTLILTKNGYYPIQTLVGEHISIWNGKQWSLVAPFSTGKNPLFQINFTDGTEIKCTPYHKFILSDETRVCADELSVGDKLYKFDMPVSDEGFEFKIDPYSQGFYSGDGSKDYKYSQLYWTKFCCKERLIGEFKEQPSTSDRLTWKHGEMLDKAFVPINGSLSYRINWLAGLCDSDGCVTRDDNGNGIQIASVDQQFLINTKLMLSRMGVRAKVVDRAEPGNRILPDGRGGTAPYFCQRAWILLIGNQDTYQLTQLGLKTERLEIHSNPPQRDARRFIRVASVTNLQREEETFCVIEPFNHSVTFNGIVTGNCLEILLREYQTCNLSEVVLRPYDTKEAILNKIKAATILGTWQSTLDQFNHLRKKWTNNQIEERLLGVSLTGVCDYYNSENNNWIRHGKDLVIETNRQLSKHLDINPSAATTCIKPSGTVSQLVNSASGIHPRHAQFYIRNVRNDKKDPLTQFLIDQGVPYEDDVQSNSNVVFSFPTSSPENSIVRSEMSALDHLELYQAFQEDWCEHKPSVTITVKEHEWLDIGAYVYKNMDNLIGVSFLPHTEHVYRQAPYQDCTEEEYKQTMKDFPKELNWELLKEYEKEDNTVASQELACAAGFCEII